MDHLLADGVHTPTFVFTFLPAYLVNAKNNKSVGLYRGLFVLVELIDILSSNGFLERSDRRAVIVNLQDLADFTQKVESSGVFMAVAGHSSFVAKFDRLECIVSAKHKEHVSQMIWSDEPTQEMRSLIRRVDRRVYCVNKEIERLTH